MQDSLMDNIKIRQIQKKDDSQLFKLVRQSLREAHLDIPGTAYFDESIKEMSSFYLNHKKRDYFVLVDQNDEVLGGIGYAEFNGSDKIAELQKLYLFKKAQGKGLSYKLISLVEKEAKKAGYDSLYLETHSNLAAAIYIYKKLGYALLKNPLPGSEHSTMDHFFIKELK